MEKNNKGLVIALVFLIVCVVGLSGFIAYDKLLKKDSKVGDITSDGSPQEIKKDNPQEVEEKPEEVIVQPSTKTVIDLEVTNLGIDLFQISSYSSLGCDYPLYKLGSKTKITYDDISEYDLLASVKNAGLKIPYLYEDPSYYKLKYNKTENYMDGTGYTLSMIVPYNTFNTTYRALFGDKMHPDIPTEPYDYFPSVIKKGNNVEIVTPNQGNCDETCLPAVSFDSAKLVGNRLEVYVWKYVDCGFGNLSNPERNTDPFGEIIVPTKLKANFVSDENLHDWHWESTEKVN